MPPPVGQGWKGADARQAVAPPWYILALPSCCRPLVPAAPVIEVAILLVPYQRLALGERVASDTESPLPTPAASGNSGVLLPLFVPWVIGGQCPLPRGLVKKKSKDGAHLLPCYCALGRPVEVGEVH